MSFPEFGLGFDAHHFSVLHRHRLFFDQSIIGPACFRDFHFGGIHHHALVCRPFASRFFFSSEFLHFGSAGSSAILVPQAGLAQTPETAAAEKEVARPSEAYVPSAQTPEQRASFRLNLLVLKDNSMHAVADYWLEDRELHYTTSYDGEMAVPLEWVDLEMTQQFNRERATPFVLRSRPSAR